MDDSIKRAYELVEAYAEYQRVASECTAHQRQQHAVPRELLQRLAVLDEKLVDSERALPELRVLNRQGWSIYDFIEVLRGSSREKLEGKNLLGYVQGKLKRKDRDKFALQIKQKDVWSLTIDPTEDSRATQLSRLNRSDVQHRIHSCPMLTEISREELEGLYQTKRWPAKGPAKPLSRAKKGPLDLLLYLIGITTEGGLVESYEATQYNARERRSFADSECKWFGYEDNSGVWRAFQRNYWILLQHPEIWRRVVYPLQFEQQRFPETIAHWREAFTEGTLGSVVASIIMAGWGFHDSAEAWFGMMEQHRIANYPGSDKNFVAVSAHSCKHTSGKKSLLTKLSSMYLGHENLQQHWDDWRNRYPEVCRHVSFVDEADRSRIVQELSKGDRLDENPDELRLNYGIYADQLMPVTIERTRSYLGLLDLPPVIWHITERGWQEADRTCEEETLKLHTSRGEAGSTDGKD